MEGWNNPGRRLPTKTSLQQGNLGLFQFENSMEGYFLKSVFLLFFGICFASCLSFRLLGFLAFRLLGFLASRLLGFLASRLLGFSVGLCGFWWLIGFGFSHPLHSQLVFDIGFPHPQHHQFLSGKCSLYLCLCMSACMYVCMYALL